MPSRRPRTPQLGAQESPGATQEAPKRRQEPPKSCPRGVQEPAHRRLGAKTRQKTAPDPLQSRPGFLLILATMWNHFGWISRRILWTICVPKSPKIEKMQKITKIIEKNSQNANRFRCFMASKRNVPNVLKE